MNAKKEFLLHVGDPSVVKCATITKRSYDNLEEFSDEVFNLSVGHSAEDMFKFISSLDFEYNDEIDEELIGFIWYYDGTWSFRDGNNDFNGHWRRIVFPEIPKHLKSN